MAIHFRVETGDVMRAIRRLAREDAPIVTAYALTKTAQDIKEAEVAVMKTVFDRPSRFTLNALYMKPATKRDLVAMVYFKEGFGSIPAWRYLGPQVDGGKRQHKAHEKRLIRAGHMKPDEFAVPGAGAKLDKYGNLSGATIERILSHVQAAEQFAGYQANATNSRRSRAKRKKSGTYFVLRPDGTGRGRGSVAPGIYLRQNLTQIVPVVMFVKAPHYKKRFPFYETARAVFNKRLVLRAQEGFARFVTSRMKKAA
ncbi:hypothetical protein [Bradyrhizobium retamae]|uniref:Uncharacterized protein n=1 Tax=Bradyrhizobium retamae TaxID=1300035 RepID=A0A0R3M9L8_9BRAD|nr:hypothetical protein [Bradyrhizobium retamae]KRR16868.1 hypothetical protein CQ13_36540 [Bradyrhizobium retamae]